MQATEFRHLKRGDQVACGQKENGEEGIYVHLDAFSFANGVSRGLVRDGIMHAAIQKRIPLVLAGSIRDDGPMPEVIGDVYRAQAEMRALTGRATTVIALTTQLHAIAAGNQVLQRKFFSGA